MQQVYTHAWAHQEIFGSVLLKSIKWLTNTSVWMDHEFATWANLMWYIQALPNRALLLSCGYDPCSHAQCWTAKEHAIMKNNISSLPYNNNFNKKDVITPQEVKRTQLG